MSLSAHSLLGHLGVMPVLEHGPLLLPRHLPPLLLLLVGAVLRGALVEQLGIGLHQQLEHVEGETMHSAVPMLLGVLVQRPNDDGEQLLAVLVDKLDDVVVVPEEERALCDLEVRARDAQREPPEKHVLHAVKLGGLRELQGFFQLVQEEDLLRRDGHGPEAKHGRDDVVREPGVLLHVLRHAVGKLLVEGRQRLDLVQRDQRLDQEVLVLILQRQREAVDDATQDLEKLSNTVVRLALVDNLEEHVLDSPADEGPQGHELAIDAVQDGLEVVPLAGVLRVEQLKKLQHEVLVDKALGDLWVDVVGDHETQEKLVDDLEVRPGPLKGRLVVFWVGERQRVLVPRLQCSEDVGTHHADDVLHQRLVEAVPRVVHVLDDLEQRLALGFLILLVGVVVEVEHNRADLHLFPEELGALSRRCLSQVRQRRERAALARALGRLGRPSGPRLGLHRCGIAARCATRGGLLLVGTHPALHSLDELHIILTKPSSLIPPNRARTPKPLGPRLGPEEA
mmetsp:Transcript_77790/g.168251  ORF Transcript_77790/g.168251 Transcript_77790/m.168251 type:complete len:509 (-) Transcript_77790:18-1544(-)